MIELEKDIERFFVNEMKKAGALCMKFTSPGFAGVPDRIVLKNGKCFFVELKRHGEKPRKLQEYVHKQFLKHGFAVEVIDSKDGAAKFAERLTQ